MDEHNVHHFWGISPAIDLGALVPADAASLPVDQPIRLLQVAPYDARHTLTTICRAERHPHLREAQQPVQLLVWEDSPEGLARHVLLLAVLLDGSLPPRERTELLLELHGNVVLRERAASYLDEKARQLEALVVELAAGAAGARQQQQQQGPGEAAPDNGLGTLRHMLDVSTLKYQERDLVVEALQRWRSSVPYDAVKAWDARARKWYGDRYDFRRNMVDWDYHMRLQPAGTPGGDPAAGSIIHFHHFRHWRMHGVAHELRDSHYNQPNRSLLSTAYGRTKEFKDRQLRDVGRSVSAWGLWCDALNSPYHAFGTLAEDSAFYRVSNKQFVRTAVDIAEHNVMSLLHELRTGERLVSGSGPGGEPHRAKVARGPTSLEDLTGQQEGQGQEGQGQGGKEPGQQADGPGDSTAQGQEGATAQHPADADGGTEGTGPQPPASEASGAGPQGTGTGATAHAVPTYRSGGKAQVAKSMAAAAAAMAAGAPPAEAGGEQQGQGGEAGSGAAGAAGPAAQSAGAPAAAGGSQEEDAARQKMAAEDAALRAAEAARDAEGARRACRFRLVLLTGDLAKGLTGRAKFASCVTGLALGHRHIHMLGPEHGLQRVAAPGAQLVAENARHVLQLTKEQAAAFSAKVDELAAAEGAGWERVAAPPAALGLTEAHQLYHRPTGAAAAASSG